MWRTKRVINYRMCWVSVSENLLKLAETYKSKTPNDRSLTSGDLFQKMIAKLSRFDLLLGIVPAESFPIFTADDIQYGIEADRRSKILKTFIKNVYRFVFHFYTYLA